MERFFSVVSIVFILSLVDAHAANTDSAEHQHAIGRHLYEVGDYAGAVRAFERAVAQAPGVAAYHRALGRAYGRLAEDANWLTAISLARKTRASLERAVELDDTDVSALSDLRDYYAQAPYFLGGGKDRAKRITRRIETLCASLDAAAREEQCD